MNPDQNPNHSQPTPPLTPQPQSVSQPAVDSAQASIEPTAPSLQPASPTDPAMSGYGSGTMGGEPVVPSSLQPEPSSKKSPRKIILVVVLAIICVVVVVFILKLTK
jgi:hypothetical protein